jgi:UDP-glucose 4-epimerase
MAVVPLGQACIAPIFKRGVVVARILITGAGGFVGGLVVERLAAQGRDLVLAGRNPIATDHRFVAVGWIGARTDWREALNGCETVIHLAAQTPKRGVAQEAYHEVNGRGTARLVEQATTSGVQTFIHLSSIFAVTGNSAAGIIDEAAPARPETAYGRSKLAGERHVAAFAGEGRKAVILRPPIVYGAGARGNWRLLQRLAATGLPLPFGAVRNRRTLIAGEDLADAIAQIASHSYAEVKAGTYVVSDPQPVSLAEMLSWLREGMGIPPRLLPLPEGALELAMNAAGQARMARSLLGDLELDSSLFRATFHWSPKIPPRDGIMRSGAGFNARSGAAPDRRGRNPSASPGSGRDRS